MTLSPIFALADRYIEDSAALDPCTATMRGIAGFDHLLTDFSPDGTNRRVDSARAVARQLASMSPMNDDDRRASEFITERLESVIALHDAGEWMLGLRVIGSPVTMIRGSFDLMVREGEVAWTNIAARLEAVPEAIAGFRTSLEHGAAVGTVTARRQALAVATQCNTWAKDRWFDTLTAEAAQRGDVAGSLVARLDTGAENAAAAFGSFATYLREAYAPRALDTNGCGPQRYRVNMQEMLGADLDPRELYDWAWHDYADLRAEMRATCERIRPGAGFAEVIALLDSDPARSVVGADAYRDWLQAMTDHATERSLEHFEIPEVMRRCEARLAPAGSAAAPYYTGPSEDFSRPGRTWYPTLGRELFPKWGNVTTCYHESVPGHHLQIGYTRLRSESLSRIQRSSFIAGHGEGWALYAERLCDELGWFDNPDDRLGFLAAQMLRSVRVIVDIGMHLGYRIPAATTTNDGCAFHPGDVWTPELAYEFACSETGQSPAFLASEIDRYLGWPAQAISYKVGEREWLGARADTKARLGGAFDLRSFHTFALGVGPVGLAQLRSELAGFSS